MIEVLWVVGGLLSLGGLAWLVASLAPLMLLKLALVVTLVGATLGFPFGLLYHLRLRAELLRLGPLPARWFLAPTRLHEQLDEEQLGRVRWSFALGALGFFLMMTGCMLSTLTLFTYFMG